jgi:hypothetical protein
VNINCFLSRILVVISRIKDRGGLRVRRLKEFNLALIGKWCWRVLDERESFWYQVLSARYGEEQGRLCFVGGRGSVWWQQLNGVVEGVRLVGW